jgi:hypothetical protein
MKKLFAPLCASIVATSAFAQGTITVGNGSYAFARTNATGIGWTAGNTAPVLGGFYYAVFTAASTVTSIDVSLQNLLTSTWTFTGVYATNSAVATGGRLLNGASGIATTQGWTPGQTNSYLLLGWSSNLATSDVNSILNQLRGAHLQGGSWEGGGFATNNFSGNAFLGVTPIGFGEAGGGTTGLGPLLLFGATNSPAGNPIGANPNPSPFDLFVVGACPEPSAFALAGLGAAAVLFLRRRNLIC